MAAARDLAEDIRSAAGALAPSVSWVAFSVKFGNCTCHFGPLIVCFKSSRCDGWIGAVEERPVEVSRGLGEVWEPFFERGNFLGGFLSVPMILISSLCSLS